MFKYENITFGADPELFLRDKVSGVFTPACGLVGGTKKRPKKIDKKGHCIQEDNVMVEFNIPPARDAESVVKSISLVLGHLSRKLPQFDLVISAAQEFDPDLLEQHPKAKEFGCDPDYDAWKMLINPAPNPNTNIRTCGGHIHVGYNNPTTDNQVALVRAMDLFLGVPLIERDPDKVRKSRYGKAGAFRPKDYGVEWRVASNYWIGSEDTIRWAYNQTMKATHFLNAGNAVIGIDGEQIQNIINSGDEGMAHSFITRWNENSQWQI